MATKWINKGNPDCNGIPEIDEPIEGILRVRCPKCPSEFTTPKL